MVCEMLWILKEENNGYVRKLGYRAFYIHYVLGGMELVRFRQLSKGSNTITKRFTEERKEMKRNFKLFSLLITILALMVVTACGSNNAGTNSVEKDKGTETAKEKTLIIGMSIPPVAFNPLANGDISSIYVQGFLFDPLLVLDETLNYTPKLATSIDTVDNQNYTINLDQNAKWTDGTPITADDVIFTLNYAADQEIQSVYGAFVSILEGVEATGKLPEGQTEIPSVKKVDDHTVTLITKQPVDPNLVKEQIGSKILILPKHVLEGIAKDQLGQDPFMLAPTVSSGAFKFVKYEKDQYVQLVANDDYYKGTPKLSNIYIKLLDSSSLVTQLRSGEIHTISGGSPSKIPVSD